MSVIPSLPLIYRRYSGIRPGLLLLVLRGARCTFVLLSGPVWARGEEGGAPTEGPGQFYCPDTFQPMKNTVGSEGGV